MKKIACVSCILMTLGLTNASAQECANIEKYLCTVKCYEDPYDQTHVVFLGLVSASASTRDAAFKKVQQACRSKGGSQMSVDAIDTGVAIAPTPINACAPNN
jgi:hypothetical protein